MSNQISLPQVNVKFEGTEMFISIKTFFRHYKYRYCHTTLYYLAILYSSLHGYLCTEISNILVKWNIFLSHFLDAKKNASEK